MLFLAFIKDDSAQGLVEYALVISLVSMVAVASMRVLGRKSNMTFSRAARFLK